MENVITLSHFGIQCDWEDALGASTEGKCWVSVRTHGQDKSVQSELRRTASNSDTIGSFPFVVVKEKSSSRFLTLQNVPDGQECVFVATSSALGKVHKAGVIAMDVSEGGLGVSICKNNELKIWETDTGNVRRVLQGHLIDAYTCRFFPSGVVILSGGADCCIKIWSAETGDCPVTFKGHTGPIAEVCIVDRGRNIISVSKDGSARLWDCGEAKCLATIFSCKSAINSCILMAPTNYELGNPIQTMSDREVGTKGKLLVVGREDGKVSGVSVAARKELFTCILPSAVNRVVQVGYNSFAGGCQGGEILVFQLNSLSQPIKILSPTSSPILDLLIHPHKTDSNISSFWASKGDGTCVLINPSIQPCSKVIQLTGPDCDPVYQLRNDLDFIYSACRDGLIRKYSLKVINSLAGLP